MNDFKMQDRIKYINMKWQKYYSYYKKKNHKSKYLCLRASSWKQRWCGQHFNTLMLYPSKNSLPVISSSCKYVSVIYVLVIHMLYFLILSDQSAWNRDLNHYPLKNNLNTLSFSYFHSFQNLPLLWLTVKQYVITEETSTQEDCCAFLFSSSMLEYLTRLHPQFFSSAVAPDSGYRQIKLCS